MKNNTQSKTFQPTIVKFAQNEYAGMVSIRQDRYGIGYVLDGKKFIYDGDTRKEVAKGEIYYLGPGHHYTENIPSNNTPYEQITFFYGQKEMVDIVKHLHTSYHLKIVNDHSCSNCSDQHYVICPSWGTLRAFFHNVNQYYREGIFVNNQAAENIKLTELVYLLISNRNCCLKAKILSHIDSQQESFEQIIHNNIFNRLAIEDLATLCNMSLTTFKKEFTRQFNDSPHRWLTRQRLMHSRLMLISTNKTVADIGNKCGFPNTSHFIKLFKKEFVHTPAAYRKKHAEKRRSNVHTIEATGETAPKIINESTSLISIE